MTSDPSSPPTALWVVPVPDLGGVARHVLDAARAGVPGWRMVVLCPEGELARSLRAQGAAVTVAPFGPDAGLAASLRSLSAAVTALRPKIVHSHLAYADFVSALTWLPKSVRRVSTEHGIAGDDAVYHGSSLKARVMAKAHAVRQRRFAARIAVSEATAQTMRAKWGVERQIVVIPNGVDAPVVRARSSTGPAAPRILSLARLAPEKRLDQLLEAFALLRAELPGATLTLAGEGPLEDDLRAQISRLELDNAVRLPGFVDADAAMAEADVVVQLSVWENCSYTLLDAVTRGIPVIASRVGGNPEIVPESSLVDADDPAAVAAGIRAVLAAPSKRSRSITVAEMTRRIGVVYDRTRESSSLQVRPIAERWVISLVDSPRREAFFSQPASAGFEIFDAFDGRHGAGLDRFDADLFHDRYDRPPKGGEIGCAISHLELLRTFGAAPGAGCDVLLVAEDDAQFMPDFESVIIRVCERTRFDVVLLANPFEDPRIRSWLSPVSDLIPALSFFARFVGKRTQPWRYRVGRSPGELVGTGLYIVTRDAAQRLVDFADSAGRISWVADDYRSWHTAAGVERVYLVRPNLCGWMGDSEIHVNQDHLTYLQTASSFRERGGLELVKYLFGRKSWLNRFHRLRESGRATVWNIRNHPEFKAEIVERSS